MITIYFSEGEKRLSEEFSNKAVKKNEKTEVLRKIFEGDRIGARRKILKSILETPEHRSFFSEIARRTGLSRRTVLSHLAYLVDSNILAYSYEPVPVGEQQRLVMVKWYCLNKGLEWLADALE